MNQFFEIQSYELQTTEETFKILGRLRSKYGGTIETFFINEDIAINIPERWEFISKIKGLPKTIISRYAMLYRAC